MVKGNIPDEFFDKEKDKAMKKDKGAAF